MGIPIGGSSTGSPSLKLDAIGKQATVMICHHRVVPVYVYQSNPPRQELSVSGKPKTQELLTVIYGAGTAVKKDGDSLVPCVDGEELHLYIKGHKRWCGDKNKTAGTCCWSHAMGDLEVGDVLTVKYDRDEQTQANPRKVWSFLVERKATAESLEKAEAAYRRIDQALRSGDQGSAGGTPLAQGSALPVPAAAAQPHPDDDIPF